MSILNSWTKVSSKNSSWVCAAATGAHTPAHTPKIATAIPNKPGNRIQPPLETELDSDKFAPVRVHAGDRRIIRILQHFPDRVELNGHKTIRIPVGAEG